jgi:hypothetical protein
MKRVLMLTLLFAGLVGGIFCTSMVVRAEGSPMTEAHIARIRSNCIDAQSQLTQLHATDALLRVNRGQLYELISTKLMSPFNSRLALNKLDDATLVSTSALYDQQLMDFRLHYQQYEEAMSSLLKIHCVNQPVAFYDSVSDARAKRSKVHESTVKLQESIKSYGSALNSFITHFKEGKE